MKAILVLTSTNPFFEEELKSLCEACHIEIGDVVIQKLEKINPATYIGKGKIEEIKLKLQDEMIIFDDELTPLGAQVKNKLNLIEESLLESLPALEKNWLKSSNKDKYKDKEERITKFRLLL